MAFSDLEQSPKDVDLNTQMSMQGYFDVLTQTPARTLLESLKKKKLEF